MEDADGDGITGVNLETGDMRYYKTSWAYINGLYYENGYLYIAAGSGWSNIYQMDVISGEREHLAYNVSMAWMENRYLYYIWYDSTFENWNLSVLNLDTKQSSAEVLAEPDIIDSYLQTVGDELLVTIPVYYDEYLYKVIKCVFYKYRANTLSLERLDRKEVPVENP